METLSPERIYISYPYINESIKKHLLRYEFATQFAHGRCLDCACGSGYGSVMLSGKCTDVIGADISDEAISYATKQNARANITYLVNGITTLYFPENHFDSIVSLETLEHISSDFVTEFFKNVKKILKPNGVFVCSTPMLRYKDGQPYVTSPYHINEMPRERFEALLYGVFNGYWMHLYHQKDGYFLPLQDETTGFCIAVISG